MNYKEFIQELISRFGEEKGIIMALRAEVGFLRRFTEVEHGVEFVEKEQAMIQDFLERHPKAD